MHYQHSFSSLQQQQQRQGSAMATNPFERPLTPDELTHQQQLLDIERRLVERLTEVETSEPKGKASDLYQRVTHRIGNVQERLRYYAFRSGTTYTPRNAFYAGASPFDRSTASGYAQRDAEATMRRWDDIINRPLPGTMGIPRRSPGLEEQREDLFQQGLANPHFRPVGEQNPITGRYETFERTTPRDPFAFHSTANMPGVTSYPAMPMMHQDWTPTQRGDIRMLMDTLRAKEDVAAGTLTIEAVARILKDYMGTLNLPLPVLAAIQNVVERGQQAGWTGAKIKQELDTALGTSATPVADPFSVFPSRDTRMAGIDSARQESDAIFKSIATKMGTDWQKLRDTMVGKGGSLSDEHVAFIKSPRAQKEIEGSAGTGKSTIQTLAALYGASRGWYQLEQFIFNAKTHTATDALKETWDTLHNKGLLPGVNYDHLSKQFTTMDAMMYRSLTSPQGPDSGKTPLDLMGMSGYQLQGVPSRDASFETFTQAAENERNTRYNQLREMPGGLPDSSWSYQRLNQEVERVRNSQTDPSTNYKKMMEQGAADVASGRLSTVASYLYRVEVSLDKSKRFDFARLPSLWTQAVEAGHIGVGGRILLGDEFQDNPRDMMTAMSKFGSTIMGADLTQQGITGSTVDMEPAIAHLFPHMQRHQLSVNFRNTQLIASAASGIRQWIVEHGGTTGPAQVSASPDLGEFVSESVSRTYPQMYDQMVSGFYERVGVTPQMIAHNVQSGAAHPLVGYTSAPAQSPFIVQMGKEKDDLLAALTRSLEPHLGAAAGSAASSMVYQPQKWGARQHFKDEATEHLIRMATLAQIKGGSVNDVFMSAGHHGQWTDVGHAKNVFVGITRARRSATLFSAVEPPPFSPSRFDNTPVDVGGGEYYSRLRAQSLNYEATALSQHGASYADMPGVLREALTRVNDQMNQATVSLDPATQAAIGPFLSLIAQLAPHEAKGFTQEGSGVMSVQQMLGGTSMDYDVNPDDAAAYNVLAEGMGGGDAFTQGNGAGALTKQWNNAGDPMGAEYRRRFVEEVASRGPNVWGESRYGNLPTNLTDFLEMMRKLISPAGERIKGPKGQNLLDNVRRMGPVDIGLGYVNSFTGGVGELARAQQEHDAPDMSTDWFSVSTPMDEKGAFGNGVGISASADPMVYAAMRRAFRAMGHNVLGKPRYLPITRRHLFDDGETLSVIKRSFQRSPLGLKSPTGEQVESLLESHSHESGADEDILREYIEARTGSVEFASTIAITTELIQGLARAFPQDKDFLWAYGGSGRMAQKPNVQAGDLGSARSQQQAQRSSFIHVSNLTPEKGYPSQWRGQTGAFAPLTSQGDLQTHALLQHIFVDEHGNIRSHAAVSGKVSRLPYERGSMIRGIGSIEEGAAKGYPSQWRNQAGVVEMEALYQMLEGGMKGGHAGAYGGVKNPYGGEHIGLTSLEKELAERVNHPSFAGLPAAEQDMMLTHLRQVTMVRKALASGASREQLGHTLSTLFRTATGQGPYTQEGNNESQKWTTFFSGLRQSEEHPRDLSRMSTFIGGLQQATGSLQRSGTITRAMLNQVLAGVGMKPDDRMLTINRVEGYARTFGAPGTELNLAEFARSNELLGGKTRKEQRYILSEMTRLGLHQGQSYAFMGGVEGFGGMGKSQAGKLAAGMVGTLHPSGFNVPDMTDEHGKPVPYPFGETNRLGNWRDANVFSQVEYGRLSGKYGGSDKWPLGMPQGPLFQFNPGGNSPKSQWIMVRPDQLAHPEMAKEILGSREGGVTPQLRYQANVPNIVNAAGPDLVEVGKFLQGQHRVISMVENDKKAISGMGQGELQARHKQYHQDLMRTVAKGTLNSLQAQYALGTYLHMRHLEQLLGLDPTVMPKELLPFVQQGGLHPALQGFVDQHAHFGATASAVPAVAPGPLSVAKARLDFALGGDLGGVLTPSSLHGLKDRYLATGGTKYWNSSEHAALFAGSAAPPPLSSQGAGGAIPMSPPPASKELYGPGGSLEGLEHIGRGASPVLPSDIPEEPDWIKNDEGGYQSGARGRGGYDDPYRRQGKWIAGQEVTRNPATGKISVNDVHDALSSWTQGPGWWAKEVGGVIGKRPPSASADAMLYDTFKDTPVGPLPPPPPSNQASSSSSGTGGTSMLHHASASHAAMFGQWNKALDEKLAGIRGTLGMKPGGEVDDLQYRIYDHIRAASQAGRGVSISGLQKEFKLGEKEATAWMDWVKGNGPVPGGKSQVHVTADKVEINAPPGTNPAGWARIGTGQPPLSEMPGATNAPPSGSTGLGGAPAVINWAAMSGTPGGPGGGSFQGFTGAAFVPRGGALGGVVMGVNGPPPPTNPFGYGNTELSFGHQMSRIGYELSALSQTMTKTADDAAKVGGDYRHATMMVTGANQQGRMGTNSLTNPASILGLGPTTIPGTTIPALQGEGTQGFFNFSSPDTSTSTTSVSLRQGGRIPSQVTTINPAQSSMSPDGTPLNIATLQSQFLPMYSMKQIAQGFQNYTAVNSGTQMGPQTIKGVTSVMSLAAMAGMDPTEVTNQMAQIAGNNYQSNYLPQGIARPGFAGTSFDHVDPNATNRQLTGMIFSTFGGHPSDVNVQPYIQSMASITPTISGLGPVAGSQSMLQAGTIFQMALKSGMSAQNLPDVAQAMGGLAQVGSHPGLQGQYFLAQQYGEKALTASPEYFQYKQSQQQQGMQLAGLQLQQKMNVPQIQINADNAQIQMDRVNIAAQQFSLAQNQASFAFGQYLQTQELGPIGATPQQTGRSDYFAYMRKQMQAGYNPLSADSASSFQFKGQPFGLQNVEFYAGIEHQRNMLTLSRSPLLKDAAFQEQMKYLNQQETFYNQELQLQNQQRQFTKTWGEKSLDLQARELKAAEAVEKYQEQQLKVDIEQQKILAANLPQMIENLHAIIINTQQQMAGQGPIHGGNLPLVGSGSIIQNLANDRTLTNDKALYQRINAMGLDPKSNSILLQLVKQARSGASPDSIMKSLSASDDQQLIGALQKQVTAGAYPGQQQAASQQDASLLYGGTDANWKNLTQAVKDSTDAQKKMADALSPTAGLSKLLGGLTGALSGLTGSVGGLANIMGVIEGIFKAVGGAGIGGVGGASMGGAGQGGMVGPPPTSGEFSSDSSILAQMNQAKAPVGVLTRLLEGLQSMQMQRSGSSSYAHYGIGSPNVNADFHQKMWYGLHQGVDLQASQGSPLSEFIGGEVKATGFFPWGGEIDVEIPGGTTERYLHLSQIGVHPGQVVRRGQRIGLTGGGTPASGFGKWSHGSHLHTQYDYGNINQGIDPWVIWAMAGEKNLGMFVGSPGMSASQPGMGSLSGKVGGGGLYHLHDGGIAMRPLTSRIADGGEPEAVIPLSKLKSILSSVGSGTGGTVAATGHSTSRQVQVDKLVGTLNLTVNTAASTMNEQEKDGLMSDVLDALNTALLQFIGKIG